MAKDTVAGEPGSVNDSAARQHPGVNTKRLARITNRGDTGLTPAALHGVHKVWVHKGISLSISLIYVNKTLCYLFLFCFLYVCSFPPQNE